MDTVPSELLAFAAEKGYRKKSCLICDEMEPDLRAEIEDAWYNHGLRATPIRAYLVERHGFLPQQATPRRIEGHFAPGHLASITPGHQSS